MVKSAGVLLFRTKNKELEVFLVHPGGPFFAKRDNGIWSIPKGGIEEGESDLDAGKRELWEETSLHLEDEPETKFLDLGTIKYSSGKQLHFFAFEYNDEIDFKSITTFIEFPYKSGTKIEIPENDQGGWFTIQEALVKLNKTQATVLPRLLDLLK